MKNRKFAVVAFLLVAAMLLGVGYAALNDELTISGTVAAEADNFQEEFEGEVYFSAASATEDSCSAAVDASDNDKATFTIPAGVLTTQNDSTTATFTIKNDSDLDAVITLQSDTKTTNNTEYFSVNTSWDTTTVAGGATTTVTVTVELIKTPDVDQNATFELVFDVESAA